MWTESGKVKVPNLFYGFKTLLPKYESIRYNNDLITRVVVCALLLLLLLLNIFSNIHLAEHIHKTTVIIYVVEP